MGYPVNKASVLASILEHSYQGEQFDAYLIANAFSPVDIEKIVAANEADPYHLSSTTTQLTTWAYERYIAADGLLRK